MRADARTYDTLWAEVRQEAERLLRYGHPFEGRPVTGP